MNKRNVVGRSARVVASKKRPLTLSRETLRSLSEQELVQVAAGIGVQDSSTETSPTCY